MEIESEVEPLICFSEGINAAIENKREGPTLHKRSLLHFR